MKTFSTERQRNGCLSFVNNSKKDQGVILYRIASVLIILATIVESLWVTYAIPQFDSLFKGYGEPLPILTNLIVFSPIYIWLLPIIIIATLVHHLRTNKKYQWVLVVILTLGIIYIPLATYSLYLPIHMWEGDASR
jgi:type II secretory pathway component PulF